MSSRRPILLVDDDPAVLQSLGFWLEAEGYEVLAYQRPDDVDAAKVPRDSVLIVDQRLPGSSGLELLDRLRHAGLTLPAILITTNPSPLLQQTSASAGVPIVEKPLIGDELLMAIRSACFGTAGATGAA